MRERDEERNPKMFYLHDRSRSCSPSLNRILFLLTISLIGLLIFMLEIMFAMLFRSIWVAFYIYILLRLLGFAFKFSLLLYSDSRNV